MRDPLERTKVVVRHLPPAITQPALLQQIDGRFAGRYKWVCFRPGNSSLIKLLSWCFRCSQKNYRHSCAYIDFNRPDDVIEFAEFFDGHMFVNEKGNQFKAVVEYAPSQRVPKAHKQDGREGTISRDPEFLDFLQILAKPVENLPSAEIQLEKKEAERAGAAKEAPISTPLMDFVRQKRAAKIVSRRSSVNGKLRRAGSVSSGTSNSATSKRGAERRKVPSSMYVLRDSAKHSSGKEKPTFILVQRRGDQKHVDTSSSSINGTNLLDDEMVTGSRGADSSANKVSESGKKKILLMKGKERETLRAAASSGASLYPPLSLKQSSRPEGSGRMVRSMLPRESRQLEPEMQSQYSEKDKRLPTVRVVSKDRIRVITEGEKCSLDEKAAGNDFMGSYSSEKQDKRMRNRDRPDRGVWAPLRRSVGSHASDDSLSSTSSVNAQSLPEYSKVTSIQQGISKVAHDDSGPRDTRLEHANISAAPRNLSLTHTEIKSDINCVSRSGEPRVIIGGTMPSSSENGSHRPARHAQKESENSANLSEGKHSKRAISGYSSHEKQVWVQKAGSG